MDFRLDDDRIELQQTVGRFFTDRFSFEGVSARENAPVDRRVWSELAELGVFGLLLPESVGGSGLGVVEAAIVFEQLGFALVNGPVRWSVLAAGLVEGAATGETLVGVGLEEESAEGVVLEHARELDVVLVLGPQGVVAHRSCELELAAPLDPLDPLTPVGRFAPLGTGAVVADAATATHLRTLGRVLLAAEAGGVASRSLAVARAYALEREQFGVPIGSFQAVKHLLADMYLRVELSQSATYAAAAMLDQRDHPYGQRAAATAKLLACDAAVTNASAAVQVLGGMGFTWNMLPNYLVKRAWLLEQTFGTVDELAELVGDLVAEGVA